MTFGELKLGDVFLLSLIKKERYMKIDGEGYETDFGLVPTSLCLNNSQLYGFNDEFEVYPLFNDGFELK